MIKHLFASAWMLTLGGAMAATVQVQVVDGGGKPLPDAVVFLESPAARDASKPLRDTVRHHVYSFSPTKNFELKLYAGTDANPVVFDRTGIAVLGCNIHDNMAAWVVVVETPYYGRTNATGKVSLANVPAGSYRLRVWHASIPAGAPALDQVLTLTAADASVSVRVPGASP